MKRTKGRVEAKNGLARGGGGRPRWKRWAPFAALPPLLLLLVLGANLGFGSRASGVGQTGDAGPSPYVSLSRTSAPDFEVTTTSGARYRLADEKGKVVVLFFTSPG